MKERVKIQSRKQMHATVVYQLHKFDDWKKLSYGVRRAFIANIMDACDVELALRVRNLVECDKSRLHMYLLLYAFLWTTSNEGSMYWRDVFNEIAVFYTKEKEA